LQGGLIMLFFALGTTLPLMAIGFSSVKFSARPHLAGTFLKVAGVVVLFFALFNINAQLNVLGAPSLNNLSFNSNGPIQNSSAQTVDNDLPPLVNGKQVIKMNASSNGYTPNYFKVKAGVPVRWEINDTGTSGCTNAIISRSLFDGQIDLTPGQVSVKEFTPEKAGKYKFSCWMGMISGTIEVVDQNGSAGASANINANPAPAGSTSGFCSINGGCTGNLQ
jgi:plastocyanin